MDISKSAKEFAKFAQTQACQLAVSADRQLCHINLYRMASYHIGADSTEGSAHHSGAKEANNELERVGGFDTFDQDKYRVDWARKHQLAACDILLTEPLRALMCLAETKPLNNQALLHQLARTRLLVFGDKTAIESLSYARRAALKLHPDRNADLRNWQIPGTKYFKSLGPDYYYEHAWHGAAALLALHNGLKSLLADKHYRHALYSKRVLRGGTLTLLQAASDLTMATAIGALLCVAKGKSVALLLQVSGAGYAALAAVAIARAVAKKAASKTETKSRAIVPFRPTLSRQGANS